MVTSLSGSAAVAGSLPFEVAAANPGDTIQFASNLQGGTITLANTLDVNKALTIDGAGSNITVNGGGNRVFLIESTGVADINALTITGGAAPGAPGGGILNLGSLELSNSTVTGSSAATGGGIFNDGSLKLSNSTVTGNAAPTGGGIYNDGAGTMIMSGDTVNNNTAMGGAGTGGGVDNFGHLTILNCTIAANLALQGGGIYNGDLLNVVNSTVASNTVTGAGADGGGIYTVGQLSLLNTIVYNPNSGAATSNDVRGAIAQVQGDLFGSGVTIVNTGNLGGNQFNTDPHLGPLQDNGGPTQTMALLPGSPAIGAGAGTSLIPGLNVPATDQRGDPRPANSIDVGAFQTQPPTPPPPPTQQPPPQAGAAASPMFDPGRLALDALLVADGLVHHNAFLAAWGLGDYSRLLGTLDGAGQAQAQAAFSQDLALDVLFLHGAV
jgi:hypothetical protein